MSDESDERTLISWGCGAVVLGCAAYFAATAWNVAHDPTSEMSRSLLFGIAVVLALVLLCRWRDRVDERERERICARGESGEGEG